MHVHRQHTSHSISSITPTRSVSLKNQISQIFDKINKFIKIKFDELAQLFSKMFIFNRKPNVTAITPQIRRSSALPKKKVEILQHADPIAPAASTAAPLAQTKSVQNIEKEREVSSWALGCLALIFTEFATICYFLNKQTPITEIPALQCPAVEVRWSCPIPNPPIDIVSNSMPVIATVTSNLPGASSSASDVFNSTLKNFICGMNNTLFPPALAASKTVNAFEAVIPQVIYNASNVVEKNAKELVIDKSLHLTPHVPSVVNLLKRNISDFCPAIHSQFPLSLPSEKIGSNIVETSVINSVKNLSRLPCNITKLITNNLSKASEVSTSLSTNNLTSDLINSTTDAGNAISALMPTAEQLSSTLDSIRQIGTNPNTWIFGAGVLMIVGFAHAYFKQKKINDILQEQIFLLSEKKNDPSEHVKITLVKKDDIQIPQIEDRKEKLPDVNLYKKKEKNIPKIKEGVIINQDKKNEEISEKNNKEGIAQSNKGNPPEIKPRVDITEPIIPHLNLNDNKFPVKNDDIISNAIPEKSKIDFSRYHHPIVKLNPAFEGNEEYRVDDEKSGDSKKNPLGPDIALLGLRNLFKEKTEITNESNKSDIEVSLEVFKELSDEYKETENRIKEWILSQSNVPTNRGGSRGGQPGNRGVRGGPAKAIAGPTPRKIQIAGTLTENAKRIIELQTITNKYNDKEEELKQNLIGDDKYAKYKFDYDDFKTIAEAITKDFEIIDKFKPIPNTPRGTPINLNEEPVLTEEEKKLLKERNKFLEELNKHLKPLNNLKMDVSNRMEALNQSIKILNDIPLDKILGIDRRIEVENYLEQQKKMDELNKTIQDLENNCEIVIKRLPEKLKSPATLKILSRVETKDPTAVADLGKRFSTPTTPRNSTSGDTSTPVNKTLNPAKRELLISSAKKGEKK